MAGEFRNPLSEQMRTMRDLGKMVVYRPHRRMVIQLLFQRAPGWSAIRFPRVVVSARLGCPAAVAWLRRKRRVENGTFLTRMHWARKPRAVSREVRVSREARLIDAVWNN